MTKKEVVKKNTELAQQRLVKYCKPPNVQKYQDLHKRAMSKAFDAQECHKKIAKKLEQHQKGFRMMTVADYLTANSIIGASAKMYNHISKDQIVGHLPYTSDRSDDLRKLVMNKSVKLMDLGAMLCDSGLIVRYKGMDLHFGEHVYKYGPLHVYDDQCSIQKGHSLELKCCDKYAFIEYDNISVAVELLNPKTTRAKKETRQYVKDVNGLKITLRDDTIFKLPEKQNVYRAYDYSNVHHVVSFADYSLERSGCAYVANECNIKYIKGRQCDGTKEQMKQVRAECEQVIPMMYLGDVEGDSSRLKGDPEMGTHENLREGIAYGSYDLDGIQKQLQFRPAECEFCNKNFEQKIQITL